MIEGKVFSGDGKAEDFLQLEPYRAFIDEMEGFEPFPGTLNVRASAEEAERVREEAAAYRMDPIEHEGRELGGLTLYSLRIEGEKACVVEPDLTRYGEDVLEVVAPDRLREKLDLEDGDTVMIEPER